MRIAAPDHSHPQQSRRFNCFIGSKPFRLIGRIAPQKKTRIRWILPSFPQSFFRLDETRDEGERIRPSSFRQVGGATCRNGVPDLR